MSPMALGLALALVSAGAESLGQVCLKQSLLARHARVTWIAIAAALFAGAAMAFVGALRLIDIGTAFAVASLGIVIAALFARTLLHETITPLRWAGILLVLAGCLMVALGA
jgi:drug/metabolite transporter (DMT)-like permease